MYAGLPPAPGTRNTSTALPAQPSSTFYSSEPASAPPTATAPASAPEPATTQTTSWTPTVQEVAKSLLAPQGRASMGAVGAAAMAAYNGGAGAGTGNPGGVGAGAGVAGVDGANGAMLSGMPGVGWGHAPTSMGSMATTPRHVGMNNMMSPIGMTPTGWTYGAFSLILALYNQPSLASNFPCNQQPSLSSNTLHCC
jgi:hypothetical protein